MQFKRDISSKVLHLINFFPALILTGARQAGKTTLLKTLFPHYNYVSLDLPSLAEEAETNGLSFLARHPSPLIIDEIQYAPGLFRHLKKVIDENRHKMGQFILTGSQKFVLMQQIGDSLAGRIALVELSPLGLHEISPLLPQSFLPENFLTSLYRGFFPELWRLPDFPVESFYSSYLATYLERDIRQILNVTSLRDFERFIRLLAVRSGQLLNKSELAKEVGVAAKTIGEWLGVLEASNQIILLEPYYQNISKRIVKTPKVYFCDTGLLIFLLRLSKDSLLNSHLWGSIFETFIFNELIKINAILEHPFQIWFYRDQRQREIDFVLERDGSLNFFECKWTEKPQSKDVTTIEELEEEIHQNKKIRLSGDHHFIISRSEGKQIVGKKTTNIYYQNLYSLLSQKNL